MAATVSKGPARNVPGGAYRSRIELTCDASYPNTGTTIGYPLTASLFGFAVKIDDARVIDQCNDVGYLGLIDRTTGNLRVFQCGGSAAAAVEIGNGVDIHTAIFRIEAYGQ